MVLFARLLQEREWGPELRVQAVGAVAHDGQTAAPLWSVFCKRRHDDVTAGLDSAQNRLNVGLPLVKGETSVGWMKYSKLATAGPKPLMPIASMRCMAATTSSAQSQ
ncbi:hypothetical protein ASF19_17520 [Acidovorax sp. Leaf84]|nr:hypothetical protein ASF19_17520 [Acidovorax sp. Leaf84]